MAKYKIIPSSRTIVQSPISIGHKAEKGVEAIEFDLTAWVETYGSGTATIVMKRWGDSIPYPVALEIDENNKATWTLSDTDTAKAGMAYAQLNYIVGDEVVKKSDIYTFRVMDSLTGEGDPPEAYESWLEHLTHLAAEAMAEVLDIEGIVTDKTLTVEGGIADAKKTGDELSALRADLADITVYAENVVAEYTETPGETNDYSDIRVELSGSKTASQVYDFVTKQAKSNSACSYTRFNNIGNYEMVYVSGFSVGSANNSLCGFFDSNGNLVESVCPTVSGLYFDMRITVPSNASYIIVNGQASGLEGTVYGLTGESPDVGNMITLNSVIQQGAWNFNTGTVQSGNYVYAVYNTIPNVSKIYVTGRNWTGPYYLIGFYDSADNLLWHHEQYAAATAFESFEIDVPEGADHFVVNGSMRSGDTKYKPSVQYPNTNSIKTPTKMQSDINMERKYNNAAFVGLSGGTKYIHFDFESGKITIPSGIRIKIRNYVLITEQDTVLDMPSESLFYVLLDTSTNGFIVSAGSYNEGKCLLLAVCNKNVNYVNSQNIVYVVTTNPAAYYNFNPSIAIYGDSIAAGVDSLSLQNMISANHGIRIKNFAIGSTGYLQTVSSGTTHIAGNGDVAKGTNQVIDYAANNVLAKIQNETLTEQIICLWAGTNDVTGGHTNESIVNAAKTAVMAIMRKGKIPVVISPTRRSDVSQETISKLTEFVGLLKNMCEEVGITYIDCYNVGINPVYTGTVYFGDGLHPNDAGMTILTNRIAEGLKSICTSVTKTSML